MDIVVNFVSTVEVEGVILDECGQIARNYLSKWFLFDLIILVPFSEIFQIQELRYKRMLMLTKMSRLMNSMFQTTESKRISRNMLYQKFKNLFSSTTTAYILSSLTITIIFIHVTACLWVFLA